MDDPLPGIQPTPLFESHYVYHRGKEACGNEKAPPYSNVTHCASQGDDCLERRGRGWNRCRRSHPSAHRNHRCLLPGQQDAGAKAICVIIILQFSAILFAILFFREKKII